jgi:hypothetical protein
MGTNQHREVKCLCMRHLQFNGSHPGANRHLHVYWLSPSHYATACSLDAISMRPGDNARIYNIQCMRITCSPLCTAVNHVADAVCHARKIHTPPGCLAAKTQSGFQLNLSFAAKANYFMQENLIFEKPDLTKSFWCKRFQDIKKLPPV